MVFDLKHHFSFFSFSQFLFSFERSWLLNDPGGFFLFFFFFNKYFQRCANVVGCWQQTVDAGYTELTVNLNYDKIFQEAQTSSSDKSLTAAWCVRLVGTMGLFDEHCEKDIFATSISACPIKHQIKNRPGMGLPRTSSVMSFATKCYLHFV